MNNISDDLIKYINNYLHIYDKIKLKRINRTFNKTIICQCDIDDYKQNYYFQLKESIHNIQTIYKFLYKISNYKINDLHIILSNIYDNLTYLKYFPYYQINTEFNLVSLLDKDRYINCYNQIIEQVELIYPNKISDIFLIMSDILKIIYIKFNNHSLLRELINSNHTLLYNYNVIDYTFLSDLDESDESDESSDSDGSSGSEYFDDFDIWRTYI